MLEIRDGVFGCEEIRDDVNKGQGDVSVVNETWDGIRGIGLFNLTFGRHY